MTDYYDGLFWEAEAKEDSVKCIPPKRTWEAADYLIHYEEASAAKYDLIGDANLAYQARFQNQKLITDVECYQNYFCVCFKCVITKKVMYFERTNDKALDVKKLRWVMENFVLVTFNGKFYDEPVLFIALAGASCEELKLASDRLIQEALKPNEVLKIHEVSRFRINHIDLKEPAPSPFASLKLYGGRLHVPMLQDLPFHHNALLNAKQMIVVLWYCMNDLDNTEYLFNGLEKELKLREEMGKEYDIDLRSKSDAQVAEAVINSEITKLNGFRPQKPDMFVGKSYNYKPPSYLKYHTPLMRWVLNLITSTPLTIGGDDKIKLPDVLKNTKLNIGASHYQIGIGGLHSTETCITHKSDENYTLYDRDVESYYPRLILGMGLYPEQMGPNFLKLYASIVERRLKAKAEKNKIVNESLKICINGSFGKLGNHYSTLYAPNLLIQVTITGQLALLMLVERYELAGLSVVSGNTDGIVIKCPVGRESEMRSIATQWENDTGFKTDETRYKMLCSRDINNYIAIKEDNKIKGKGAYQRTCNAPQPLKVSPINEICNIAIEEFLTKQTPIEETILACKDITQFLTVRTVKGGAVKDGNYLGKAIRWYVGNDERTPIIYALTGNKVPLSDNAKPIMRLPAQFPDDIKYKWYIRKTARMLEEVGYY